MSDAFPTPIPTPAPAPAAAPIEPAAPAVTDVPPPDPAPAEPPAPPKGDEDDSHTLPKGVQRRIDRAVRQRYEAEARARIAEEELARYRNASREQPQHVAEDGPPTIDKFQNIEDYVAAKAKWISRQEIREALEAQSQNSQHQQAEREEAELNSSWQTRVEKALTDIPDFEDVVASSSVLMTPPMERAVLESEVGPQLAYWLAKNPGEAAKIAQMPATRAFVALGRLEEKLQTAPPPVPKPSAAPAPIQPAGSRANVAKNPDDMTVDEWMAWRRKQLNSQ